MKKFQFALERVRDWRAELAEVEEARLRLLLAELRRLERAREDLEAQRERETRALLEGSSVSAFQLAVLDHYRQYVEAEQRRLAQRMEDCGRRIAEQRGRVLEARRQFRLLDRLKQKALRRWQADLNRELENFASEVHLAKWAREGGSLP